MKKLLPILMFLAIIASSCSKENMDQPIPSNTQQTFAAAITSTTAYTSKEDINVDAILYNDCTAEDVHLTGNYQIISHFTINRNRVSGGGGMIDGQMHWNTQHVVGIGLKSGNQYLAIEAIDVHFSGSLINGSFSTSFVQRSKMIAEKGTSSFVIKFTGHATINANGEMTVSFDNFSFQCR